MKYFVIFLVLFFSFSTLGLPEKLEQEKSILIEVYEQNRSVENIIEKMKKFESAETYEDAYKNLTNMDVWFINHLKNKKMEEIIEEYNLLYNGNLIFEDEMNKLFFEKYVFPYYEVFPLSVIKDIKKYLVIKKEKRSSTGSGDGNSITGGEAYSLLDKGYAMVARGSGDTIYGHYCHAGLWGDISTIDKYKQIYTAHSEYNGTDVESVDIWQGYSSVIAYRPSFGIVPSQKQAPVEYGEA